MSYVILDCHFYKDKRIFILIKVLLTERKTILIVKNKLYT